MRTKPEIEEEILRIRAKIDDAKITERGYNTFSEMRADQTRIKTLLWVLDEK
jgi:hypothetical protein